MRFLRCAVLALLVAGCGAEEPERSEPSEPAARQQSSQPIVRDAQTAADWISEALTSSGYEADFSTDSAKALDRFFDDQMAAPGQPKPGGVLDEDLGARLFAIAAYVGEAVRVSEDGIAAYVAAITGDTS